MQNQKQKHALGACSQGRVFIFGFIRRQPYICRHFSVCKWAWQTSPGACEWHGNLFCTLFPILYRCHVVRLFEQAVKMLHILITNIGCNGLHRLVGLL